MDKILVIGAGGQIGTDLVPALRDIYGEANVIATDWRGPYQRLDVLNKYELTDIVRSQRVTQIYLLAAMLSATGEQRPKDCWDLNMQSLLSVLELAKTEKVKKVFWPSSIAAASPSSTVYGISKLSGELWCNYYFAKYGVDIRSLRYPGLISYKAMPGGGTTDYAVDIFHQARSRRSYTCFLKEDTVLPMMYMPDAIRATLELMETPGDRLARRTYDVSALSFSPKEIAAAIQQKISGFTIQYKPDHRQLIADSWPARIDDSPARKEWGWAPQFDLAAMTHDMFAHL